MFPKSSAVADARGTQRHSGRTSHVDGRGGSRRHTGADPRAAAAPRTPVRSPARRPARADSGRRAPSPHPTRARRPGDGQGRETQAGPARGRVPAHRRRARDLPAPLRRGRERGAGLSQAPGRVGAVAVPRLAQRAARRQLRQASGRRYPGRARQGARRRPERAGLHGRGRVHPRGPAPLPAQLHGRAPRHRAARPVRLRGRAVRAPARHAGRAGGHDRAGRRLLRHPGPPRRSGQGRPGQRGPEQTPERQRHHPVPHEHPSEERSLMATEVRDLTQAPERINPVPENVDLGAYKYGWHDTVAPVFEPKRGLSHDVGGIDFDNIFYFVRATEKQAASWEDLPADIKSTYDRLGIPEAEKQRLIAGVAAQYECLAGDSRVWTADRGFVPIKDIHPGDRVFAYDEAAGRFVAAPVRAAAQTDVRQTYEVQAGSRTIRATDNHPLLVLRDERKPDRQRARYALRWTTVGELRVGDFVAVPRDLPDAGRSLRLPRVAGLNGPEKTSPDVLWLLGFFVGDGNLHVSGRTWRVQFAAPAADTEVRTEIARVLREQFGLRAIEADGYRVVVNSKALVEWFERLGFVGSAHSKHVPEWVYRLPLAERLAFLGGWVDADGYIRPEESGSVVLTSVNVPLLKQAAELAQLCGLRATDLWRFESPHVRDPERSVVGFRIGISGDFERLDCRNPRRTARYGRRRYAHSDSSARGTTLRAHLTEHLGFARVTGIETAQVEPVYDIEVDGPHNFVAEGLVVHNSEVVYHKVREDLEEQGVIFLDTDSALREHEDLFREHWATVIPANDNKFSALNSAVWSGGSFIWVPEGVHVEIPLQAYFRINAQNMGQFERT